MINSPAQRPVRTILTGHHVTIVPLNPELHSATLYEGSHGPERDQLWRYMPVGPFPGPDAFREYLEQRALSPDPLFHTILHAESGRPQGLAAYLRMEPGHRCIEVGHILYLPEFQRTIGATEAMYLMARHVFEDLGYRRYEWKCDARNEPSRRAALRFGFTFEGIFRQHMIIKGCNRDTAWFSMLDADWPQRKATFERWLDPANFTHAGRQKQSLSAAAERE